MRKCPRCRVPLDSGKVTQQNGTDAQGGPTSVEVDVEVCHQCRGTFLDHGELGALTGNKDLDAFLGYGKVRPDEGLSCPACATPMAVRGFAGVTLDTCPHCGGMWFDKGEIPTLMDAPTPKLRRIS